MRSSTHITLQFRSPARSRLISCLVVAMACAIDARGVEPVPFLQLIEDETGDEASSEGRNTEGFEGVSQEAAEPPPPAELPEHVRSGTDENGPGNGPAPVSSVERVAFESRLMQFPVEGEESVLVEPLNVPQILAADEDGNRFVAPVEGIPRASMLTEEPALAEVPFPASSGKWFSSGYWYASAESLWYDRSRNKRVEIGRDLADETLERVTRLRFTTLAQPFDTAPGFRATFGRSLGRDYLDRDRLIEFTYTGALLWQGVDGWNSLTPEPTLVSPLGLNVPGFNLANTYRTSLDSNFNSFETNFRLRRRLGRDQLVMSPNGGWSRHAERGFLPGLILGARLARVDEDFWFRSRRNGVDPSVFSGDYDITTQNWLLGMNIGGELVSQNEFYYWGLRGRAAPALTFASAQQTVVGINSTNIPPPPPPPLKPVPSPVFREDRNTQTSPGFIGDLTLFAGWNVTPNFSLKVGYDFLWVAGIATATRQFNLDDLRQNPIDAGGQTFFNGVSFGLEGSW